MAEVKIQLGRCYLHFVWHYPVVQQRCVSCFLELPSLGLEIFVYYYACTNHHEPCAMLTCEQGPKRAQYGLGHLSVFGRDKYHEIVTYLTMTV